MRTYDDGHCGAVRRCEAGRGRALAVALLVAAGLPLAVPLARPALALDATRAEPVFATPEAAFERARAALNRRDLDAAMPALRFAAENGFFLAKYYLARIYSSPTLGRTDHVEAFRLWRRLANRHADVDPYLDYRAPYVARAFVALARYYRSGIPPLKLAPNLELAVDYLQHAANYFGDSEAQFELAKMYLSGEGVAADVARGKHWLSRLSRKGHAGAQAYLGELYIKGRYNLPKRPDKGLALVALAVENALPQDRIWFEDMYHRLFCATSEADRRRALAMVKRWRGRYARRGTARHLTDPLVRQARVVRTCRDGKLIPTPRLHEANVASQPMGAGKVIEAVRGRQVPTRGKLSKGWVMRADRADKPRLAAPRATMPVYGSAVGLGATPSPAIRPAGKREAE